MPTDITRNDLDNMLPQFKRAMERSHDLTALDVWGNIMDNSPQDHGRLAGSWELNKMGGMHSTVSTGVKYALVQNDGSDPYEIFPRAGTALRFEIGGTVIFAKSVLHPGITGTKYIEGSIAQTENRVSEFVQIALDEQGL